MEKPLISIIIVNFNGAEHLRKCLTSLTRIETKYQWELVVVDNNSTDNSISVIQEVTSNLKFYVQVVRSKFNLGFASGNNLGISRAKGDLFLFLNSDTIVNPDFLDPLVEILKSNSDIGAVQPTILMLDRPQIVDSVGSYFLKTGFLYHLGHNKPINKNLLEISKVFSLKGACMLFRKDVIDQVGQFDDSFFAYFEETDLCIRTILAGYSLWYVPKSVIYHKGGATSTTLPTEFVLFHGYKNRIMTYLSCFSSITLIWLMPTHISLCVSIIILYLLQGRFSQAGAILKAVLWNISHFHDVLLKRKLTQKIRKKQDKDILIAYARGVSLSYYYHLFTSSLKGYVDR